MYGKVVGRRCIIRRTTDDLVEHTLGGSGAYQPAHHHHSAHEAEYFDHRRSDISLGTKIAYMRHRTQTPRNCCVCNYINAHTLGSG